MKILVVSAADATNLSIENVIKEFIRRGHYIEIFAQFTDYKSIRMFKELSIPIRPVAELTEKVISQFDIAFCGTDAMNILRFANIYIFTYNFIFNGWASAGADFMFTLSKDRQMRYKEDCATMPIGVPKNDTPKTVDVKKQFLYIDAGHIPFGRKGKEQVAEMLLNICHSFPEYKLVVKPRWLLDDMQNLTHSNYDHIYRILDELTDGNLPDNLVLLDEHLDLQMLIDESITVITTSISCYLDAALRGKGVIVVGGFNNEDQCDMRTNVSLRREYAFASDAGCLVDYQQVTQHLPQGIFCKEEHLNRIIAYRQDASSHIVDVVEYVYETFLQHGKYPRIREYDYESYQTDITEDTLIDLNILKYKRMKNSVVNSSRIFDSIDAEIDWNDYYKTLEEIYQTFPLDNDGYQSLITQMSNEDKLIRTRESEKLMTDPINQSFLLQALYDTGQEINILRIPQEEICCNGPYYYYLGKIYEKYQEPLAAIHYYYLFLKEANDRSFIKYPQEKIWGIRNAYNGISRTYDGENMPPENFAEIYEKLHVKRLENIIPYRERKKLYQSAVSVSHKLYEKRNYELAAQCVLRYVEQSKVYNEDRKRAGMLKQENERIIHSLSYRIGCFITWLPRKTRKGIQCIKKEGVINACQHVALYIQNLLKSKMVHVLTIWEIFHNKVMAGYQLYAEVIQKYGENARLFLSAQATGDVYIHGMCFESHTKKHANIKPIFGVWETSGSKVASLFTIHNVEIFSLEEFKNLYNLLMFDSQANCKMEHLHYHVIHRHTAFLKYIEGIHGFNLFSQTLAYLNIESKQELTMPKFADDDKYIKKIFDDNALIPGKTVLLVPYAKSVRSISLLFWNKLARKLVDYGFSVCTNTTGPMEPPVANTTGVFIPFPNSVPFLEMAGATIGLRSGFQDVTNTAKCLKITLYPENNYKRSIVWSTNESYSLTDMYNQPNQYDLIYSFENEESLLQEIVERVIDSLGNPAKVQFS